MIITYFVHSGYKNTDAGNPVMNDFTLKRLQSQPETVTIYSK